MNGLGQVLKLGEEPWLAGMLWIASLTKELENIEKH